MSNARVVRFEDEDVDSMLRRFKKLVRESEVLEECRKREYFVPKAMKRQLKSERARIKNKTRK